VKRKRKKKKKRKRENGQPQTICCALHHVPGTSMHVRRLPLPLARRGAVCDRVQAFQSKKMRLRSFFFMIFPSSTAQFSIFPLPLNLRSSSLPAPPAFSLARWPLAALICAFFSGSFFFVVTKLAPCRKAAKGTGEGRHRRVLLDGKTPQDAGHHALCADCRACRGKFSVCLWIAKHVLGTSGAPRPPRPGL
jgi:hypothetical protein